MEAAIATMAAGVAGRMAPKVLDYLLKSHKQRANLERDIDGIQNEFRMISAAITEDEDCRQRRGSNPTHEEWKAMVRQLARDIEDCMDRFIHRVTLEAKASWIRRKVHRVKTMNDRSKFAVAIRRLRGRSEEARRLRNDYKTSKEAGDALESGACDEEEEETEWESTVGMKVAQEELTELIMETTPNEELKLKVVSIVGFGGIGKSLLARQVYQATDPMQYPARAWVRAAEKDPRDVLRDLLRQLGIHSTVISSGGGIGGHLSNLRASLRVCLGNRRFFIVIDDMRVEFWDDIKDAFPMVPGVSNRVIVTTVTRSIAKKCSFRDGHVYVMRTLAEGPSIALFLEKASLACPPPADSEVIRKCDGLPLALVTTARVLHGDPTREEWAALAENLGEHLETNDHLARMNRVLVRSYASLGRKHSRTCLLYLGIYPIGRPIRRGRLIRRWLAEGFGDTRSAVMGNFSELVDRSIIQPSEASSSSSATVKTCQTHGMVLEFILRKSMCQNFVAVLCDKAALPSNVRWLSLHNTTAAARRSKIDPQDMRHVRSLTVFGKAHISVLDFTKYEMLRVLDLEDCDEQLQDKHLKEICSNLLLLRYLSLRGAATITVLPKEIKKLPLLETLDLRGTSIKILPKQVLELPYLIHLFGKFKLKEGAAERKMDQLRTWLSDNSKLETLAGFVVGNNSQEFAQLMKHMEQLTKVKIWCESTTDTDANINLSHLSEAIQGFIERGTNAEASLSLSLKFNDKLSQDMLMDLSLEERKDPDSFYPYLGSLKLEGNNICSQLPPFVTLLSGLTKLCLSFPHHQLSGDILSALSSIHGLWYLKLIATQLDNLVIGHDNLGSLRRLCVVVQVMADLEIQEGALPLLNSFCLLCKDLDSFRGTTIQSLQSLEEVTLHDGLSDETKQQWKEAAKNHPRRPTLLFKLTGGEPAATPTNTAAEDVHVQSDPVASHVAPSTDILVTTLLDAISTGDSAQVDDDGQHDFARTNGPSTHMIDQINKGNPKAEMEVVAGLKDQRVEDDTQKRGRQNKRHLFARLPSLKWTGKW